jgi:phenylpyruvate tautomerase PptA (4-oxalocrotonate tautomerase family)
MPRVGTCWMPARGQKDDDDMPKMIIHSLKGTFDAVSRQRVAAELTELALDCEALPKSAFVRSSVWTYFNEYPADAVFMGGEPAYLKLVTLEVHALVGGLDEAGKRRLIKEATEIFGRKIGNGDRVPCWVVIRETAASDWGIFGRNGDLEALRASAPDEPAL